MSGGTVSINESVNVEALLSKLPEAFRREVMERALKATATPVIDRARQLCPKGGSRTGNKTGKKHLRDTITQRYREYGSDVRMTVVGPSYPDGAHGHLVEDGHEEVLFGKRTGRRVPPHPFMRPAVDQTRAAQDAAAIGVLQAGIKSVESSVGGSSL